MCSRTFETVNFSEKILRHVSTTRHLEDGDEAWYVSARGRSPLQHYLARSDNDISDHQRDTARISLFAFLTTHRRQINQRPSLFRVGSLSRVLIIYSQYSNDPFSEDFEFFCRSKMFRHCVSSMNVKLSCLLPVHLAVFHHPNVEAIDDAEAMNDEVSSKDSMRDVKGTANMESAVSLSIYIRLTR